MTAPAATAHPPPAGAQLLVLQDVVADAGRKCDSLLLIGGSGGVGTFALQAAKQLGIKKVTAVCSDANKDLCRELGADAVCSYSGGDDALLAALRVEGPFDAAFDTVSSPDDRNYEPITRSSGVLKPGALHVAINGRARPTAAPRKCVHRLVDMTSRFRAAAACRTSSARC